jgi:hypothetical protein
MAVITADIPNDLNRLLQRDKRRSGLSKSYLIRQILQKHYESNGSLKVVVETNGNGNGKH